MTLHMSFSEPISREISPSSYYNYTDSEMESLLSSLSLEETYYLAELSRRKSSQRMAREDLRLRLGHSNVLESLLHDIAKRESPPPSPKQKPAKVAQPSSSSSSSSLSATKTSSSSSSSSSKISEKPAPATTATYDEYGFAYDDGSSDEEEDNSLSLTRTISRRN